MSEPESIPRLFLAEAIATLQSQKRFAERAIAQLGDEQLHTALGENTNAIAQIVKHLAGNMRSRWTDFLTSDGEKSWRHRDNEFVDDVASRDRLMEIWEAGWARLLETLESLTVDDLHATVTIRGEAKTAARAILDQVSHYGYHIGQIVMLATHLAGDRWEWLTIPPGQSEQYNRRVWKR